MAHDGTDAGLALPCLRGLDAVSSLMARGDDTPSPDGPVLSGLEPFHYKIMREWQV